VFRPAPKTDGEDTEAKCTAGADRSKYEQRLAETPYSGGGRENFDKENGKRRLAMKVLKRDGENFEHYVYV